MADTGWIFFTANENNNGVSSQANLYASDNSRATFASSGNNVTLYNGSISITAGSTIDGIQARNEGYEVDDTFPASMDLQLGYNSRGSFVTAKNTGELNLSSDTFITVGGAADTWGRSWAVSDFTNANFAMKGTVSFGGGNAVFNDSWSVKIYYTEPVAGGWTGSAMGVTDPGSVMGLDAATEIESIMGVDSD